MLDGQHIQATAEARVGQSLGGKFLLTRLLGMGGMAAVYEARDPDGQPVALKVLHATSHASRSRHKRLLREVYAANTIGHPGVVRMFESGIGPEGCAFLAMELLEGETVEQLRKRSGGRLPLERVFEIGDALLDVLAAAHARNIIHRDIKPENLFLARGEFKVLDFGIARICEQPPGTTVHTQPGTMLGTPAFMAQEQARGRWDEVDRRTDLWAVGATLFTLASGQYVHPGRTANEQLGHAMTMSPRSLASVEPALPAGFTEVIDRTLRFDPAERWSDAAEMRAALRAARTGATLDLSEEAMRAVPTLSASAEDERLRAAGARGRPWATLSLALGILCAVLIAYALAGLGWGKHASAAPAAKSLGRTGEQTSVATAEVAHHLAPAALGTSSAPPARAESTTRASAPSAAAQPHATRGAPEAPVDEPPPIGPGRRSVHKTDASPKPPRHRTRRFPDPLDRRY